MERINSPNAETTIDARLRLMRAMWLVILISVFVFALVVFFSLGNTPTLSPQDAAILPDDVKRTFLAMEVIRIITYLLGLLSIILAAPLILRRYRRKAKQAQRPELFGVGLFIALAFTAFGAICGLSALYLSGGALAFYLLMAISALGIIMLFPRREHLSAPDESDAAATNL
jgi:amino acid transporter